VRSSIKCAPAIAIVLALVAAGCGGGNGGSTNTSATATTSSAAPPCQAQQLHIKVGRGNAATGHILAPYLLRNASGGPCTLRGFPRVVLLDHGGSAMSVAVKPRATDFFGHVPVATVAVQADGQASFHLAFEDAINGGNCPTAKSMRVTLPNGGGRLALQFGDQLACPGGVTVSPFTGGTAGTGLRTQIVGQ
jgi:Protein of unknown function (DUF4232)